MLSKDKRREIIDKLNIADVFIVISLFIEVVLYIMQIISFQESVNVIMFFNVYILFVAIMLFFLIEGINNNFLAFTFFCCFFLFLMGQKLFKYYETGGYDEFLTFVLLKLDPNEYFTFSKLMYGALISLFIGYRLTFKKAYLKRYHDVIASDTLNPDYDKTISKYRVVLSFLMLICFVCAFYMQLKIVLVKNDMSYTEGYLINVDVNPVIKVGNYLFVGFLFLFLCCRPKKLQMFIAVCMFLVVEGGLQMLIGRRALVAKALLFTIWYLLINLRLDLKKMKLRHFFTLGIFAVAVMTVFWFVERARSNSDDGFSLFSSIKDFLVSTGGSDSVIAHTIVKEDMFPKDGIVYLINPIKEALTNNALIQQIKYLFFGISTPSYAQGLDYVKNNDSFSHWISYMVNSDLYVNGYGMGTSFIAELYLAFGTTGVIVACLGIGWAISALSSINAHNKKIARNAIMLYFAYNLFVLPRSGLFDIATDLLYFIFAIVVFRIIVCLFSYRGNKDGRL